MRKSLVYLSSLLIIVGVTAAQVPQEGMHLLYLPLIWRAPQAAEYGMDFISAADAAADENRYQRGLSTGADWNRWPLYWYYVETGEGVFDWSYGDGVVANDLAHGLQTELILMGTPSFYATGGDAAAPRPQVGRRPIQRTGLSAGQDELPNPVITPPIGLYEPVFSDGDVPGPDKEINPDNKWARFVFKVVEHYSPLGVTHWEIWNEPDLDSFWAGTVEDYARLLKVGYLAARQADPNAQIIVGGLANFEKPFFLGDVLDVFAADPLAPDYGWFFDIVATHAYSCAWESWLYVYRARARLTKQGLEKDIWLNESGVPVWDDYPGPVCVPDSPYRATMEETAAYVIQSAMYARYAGAEVVFHFQLYDDCGNDAAGTSFPPLGEGESCDGYHFGGDAFGLFRNPSEGVVCHSQHPQPDTPRPAFDAFRVLTIHLRGLEPLWRERPEGQEWIAFSRPATGQQVLGLWSRSGISETAVVTATGDSALLIDYTGNTTQLVPENGVYTLQLGPATNQNTTCYGGFEQYAIGGPPLILVESGIGLATSMGPNP